MKLNGNGCNYTKNGSGRTEQIIGLRREDDLEAATADVIYFIRDEDPEESTYRCTTRREHFNSSREPNKRIQRLKSSLRLVSEYQDIKEESE